MTGQERVISVINGKKPDRMPIYGWLFNGDFAPKIVQKYGSIEACEDRYQFDLKHIFPSFGSFAQDFSEIQSTFFDDELPEIKFSDPNNLDYYDSIKKDVELFGHKKGRFTYLQTPGCFENFNGVFGIENQLSYLLMHTDQIEELYQKLADWTVQYVNNSLDLGVDMIHVSDDWGSQIGPMFSVDLWKKLVYPYHKKVVDAVKKRGAYASLHSDGNIDVLLDGVVDIGYNVVHPYQESAGMSYSTYMEKYRNKFVIMGGLDVQSTIGFGDFDKLENDINRVISQFKDGGMLYCTTHMIQPHCSIEEFTFAYDLIEKLINK